MPKILKKLRLYEIKKKPLLQRRMNVNANGKLAI